MPSAVQEVMAIEKAMVRDFNAGRIGRLIAHFPPRVVGFSSTRQERIAGRAAMRKTFNYYRQASSRLRYQISKLQIQAFADTAVATFYWTVELGAARPRHMIQGRGTHVLARQRGKWTVVHEHFSRAH